MSTANNIWEGIKGFFGKSDRNPLFGNDGPPQTAGDFMNLAGQGIDIYQQGKDLFHTIKGEVQETYQGLTGKPQTRPVPVVLSGLSITGPDGRPVRRGSAEWDRQVRELGFDPSKPIVEQQQQKQQQQTTNTSTNNANQSFDLQKFISENWLIIVAALGLVWYAKNK